MPLAPEQSSLIEIFLDITWAAKIKGRQNPYPMSGNKEATESGSKQGSMTISRKSPVGNLCEHDINSQTAHRMFRRVSSYLTKQCYHVLACLVGSLPIMTFQIQSFKSSRVRASGAMPQSNEDSSLHPIQGDFSDLSISSKGVVLLGISETNPG